MCKAPLVQEHDRLRCGACDRIYPIRNEIPILFPEYEQEHQRRYIQTYERMAKDDLEKPLEQRRDYRHQILMKMIGAVRGKRVLDIGSSHAVYLREIDAGFKVAFDIALPYLEAIALDDQVVRICGDAEYLPFARGFFDVIVVSDILEHLLDPQRLVDRLTAICSPRTRVIVHIPWEESLETYRDSPYEFTHLRSFNAYTHADLWRHFKITRVKRTYPDMKYPLVFRLERKLPLFIYNRLIRRYFFTKDVAHKDLAWRVARTQALPKGERWLLLFFKPVFRIFEMRCTQ